MLFSNIGIGRKLALSFAGVLLVLMVLSGVVIKSLNDVDSATFWNTHTYEVLERVSQAMAGMIDQETGVRGFLVSGDQKFLEPYQDGQEHFAQAFDALKQLTSDNPVQQKRLDQIKTFSEAWKTQVAEPEIRLARDPATRDQARAMEASGAGKTAMDSIRSLMHETDAMERGLLTARTAAKDWASALARWSMIVGTVFGAFLAVSFGWLLTRTIATPISTLTRTMGRLAAGDLDVSVEGTDRKDEVGAMAGAVRVFKDNGLKLKAAEAAAEQTRHMAEQVLAKTEAERAKAAAEQALVVGAVATGLERLSTGQLTYRIEDRFAADYEKLRVDFNGALSKLEETVTIVARNTHAMRSGATEISTASDDLARRTEQQAASLEETAAALDEITATVRKTSEGSIHAREVVATTKSDAEASGKVVDNAVMAMSAIEKSSQQVTQIIGVIDEIAFQTNLLALNAGVEAARAGEAGRGFAVVASEVRALAQRSAEAAKEIKALIATSSQQVSAGVGLVNRTGEALKRIVGQVAEIDNVVSDIATSTQEQATALHQVNTAINQMDQVTQQNAAMVEQSTAASHSLAKEAGELAQLVGRFEITEGRSSEYRGTSRSGATAARLKVAAAGGAARKHEAVPAGDSWEEF
ncbi:methyl-accepting chemotaxis protein [Lichenifustis flavocetrariae]|uniref:Methyl-accepting chemotaxis protein n=1 Tax=Lichenifustis flavocetrariae TaxID=2949735 RepID=A0AA42CII6_9HYPH|nr:methyl-accepting chemotaxis protein [Lichenifustis flavocetrariae]MCW6508419.1 methyl-accepting chemotaxis protein [Lichenifustis flavocetrariae]